MPSKKFTLILAILTSLIGGLACVQLFNHNLGPIFGTPPHAVGDVVYDNFAVDEVHGVTIQNNTGDEARFIKRQGVWRMVSPTPDRADYGNLQTLVYFSRYLKVQDVMRRKDTTLLEAGMRASDTYSGRYKITLLDQSEEILADYRLGRRTAWHRFNEKEDNLIETFFVRPGEKSRNHHIYVCSAPEKLKTNVRQLLDRGLARFRDHHPLLFDQQGLANITIRSKGREVVLTRPSMQSPAWQMTKPLTSRTKPDRINGLIVGLSQLEAIRIHELKSITIPPRPPGEFLLELELLHFGPGGKRLATPSTLTIEHPSPADADTVLATTNSRPELVFEIPLKAIPGRMTLAQLPLEVDQLRGRTLTSLDIGSLRAITIQEYGQQDPVVIFLGEETGGRPRWMINLQGSIAPANEAAMARVLRALTRNEVTSFASDAASDLTRYGLSPPTKRVILDREKEDPIDLRFGRGVDGRFYAIRHGTSTVAEIDPATFTAIAGNAHQWRDALLMPFSVVDLSIMKLETLPIRVPFADPALTLRYRFLAEDWEARQHEEDVTAYLNKRRADEFIRLMEVLQVERWLGEDSTPAAHALRNPTFRFTAIFQELDETGELKGFREASFDLAPASRSRLNRIFYGKLRGDSNYFILSPESYRQLTTPLLDRTTLSP